MSIKNRSFRLFAPLMISISLLTFLWSGESTAESTTTALPKFSLPTIVPSGKHLTNSTFIGHVSVLHFWASWCGYCRGEHSKLVKIKENTTIPIYSVALKDNPTSVKEYLAANGNPYTLTADDADGSLASALGVYGTPETFIIDKHGVIRYHEVGAIDQGTWNDTFLPKIQKYMNEK